MIIDINIVCEINLKSVKVYVRKGIVLFYIEKYKEVYIIFKVVEIFDFDDKVIKIWVRKCEVELDILGKDIGEDKFMELIVGILKGEIEVLKLKEELKVLVVVLS